MARAESNDITAGTSRYYNNITHSPRPCYRVVRATLFGLRDIETISYRHVWINLIFFITRPRFSTHLHIFFWNALCLQICKCVSSTRTIPITNSFRAYFLDFSKLLAFFKRNFKMLIGRYLCNQVILNLFPVILRKKWKIVNFRIYYFENLNYIYLFLILLFSIILIYIISSAYKTCLWSICKPFFYWLQT